MRNYQVSESEFGTIISYEENGVTYSFGTDPNNSDYAQYLALQAWVASGKKEQDFWTQSFE